jgi:RimJ/RimL family protein N-acetyltransferase
MDCRAARVAPEVIGHLRPLFLRELKAQLRYESVHPRGWSDTYRLTVDDVTVGYGSVRSQDTVRDTIFEWYVVPPWRGQRDPLFEALIAASGASSIECQTNDPLLYPMAQRWCPALRPTVYLFEAGEIADLTGPGTVRRVRETDATFTSDTPPDSCVLDVRGEIVGTGGYLLHYNHPFADIYMDVAEPHRRRGYGARIVAGAMRGCWLAGRVPAARCNVDNAASRATLHKAGMREIGQMVVGQVR